MIPGSELMPVGLLMPLCSGVNECPAGLKSGIGCILGSGTGTGIGYAVVNGLSGSVAGSISVRKRSIAATCPASGLGAAAGWVKGLFHAVSALVSEPNMEPAVVFRSWLKYSVEPGFDLSV